MDFGDVPDFRAALLAPPGDRNESYSASARYGNALAAELLPALAAETPITGEPVLAGASLGALAALHAHWLHPGAFAGLFLQSGSFFRRRLDGHESGFPRFARITRFVGRVHGGRGVRRARADRDHVRDGRGEPREQPRPRRSPRPAGMGAPLRREP